MSVILDVILDCLQDNWLMFPLLYIAYCILEIFERKYSEIPDSIFFGLQKFGPLIGAAFGLIPQCGFAIIAAMLYLQKNITLGTLIAVMIATSDEAIPIMISNPSMYKDLIVLLILKFIIGTVAGYVVDKVIFPHQNIIEIEEVDDDEPEDDEEEAVEGEQQQNTGAACPCCMPQYPFYLSALIRSAKIFAFIFLTSIIVSLGIEWLGEETLQSLLLRDSFFQPFISALLGFIPNCAITAVLAELYMLDALSFGSLLAGLITNAGLALVCLIRYGDDKKDTARVAVITYIVAIVAGIIVNLVI